jgi:hypothetical protein
MRRPLPGTRLELSPLGLGLASLSRRLTPRRRLAIIETAFDCGITHFDAAPIYGGGTAEAQLGRFLRGRRGDVTVATKAGLVPAGLLGRRSERDFSPAGVERSLQRSLRALRTDYLDLLLLHEPRSEDVSPGLLELLERWVERGIVRETGVGVASRSLPPGLAEDNRFPRVVQLASSALDPAPTSRPGLIVHSVLAADLARLAARWDGDPGELPSLILGRALALHPGSTVLFGTREPAHVRAATREPAGSLVERLDRLVREEERADQQERPER